jgi:prepilin peptidase CpaA
MWHYTGWAYSVLVATSGLLAYAAWTDLQEYKIRNDLVLALACLFILYAVLAVPWVDLKWDLAFAALMFVVLLLIYAAGWMGGGDVKILGVAFLWAGLSGALPFGFLLGIFSLLHSLAAKFDWVNSQQTKTGHRRIPFAPSVAGALVGVFILRALRFS